MRVATLATILLVAAFCSAAGPNKLMFTKQNLFPFGVEWVPNVGFLVSSGGLGPIHKVDDNGVITQFYANANMKDSLGLKYNDANKLLYIASADPNHHTAALIKIDVRTATLNAYVDVTNVKRAGYNGQLLPIAVAVDGNGNAYMVDAYQGIIWKIDAANQATLFVNDAKLQAGGNQIDNPQFTVGAIEVIKNQYLIVACWGGFFKIMLNAPNNVMTVTLSGGKITNPSGFSMRANGNVIITENMQPSSGAVEVKSTDDFSTMTIVSRATFTEPDASGSCSRDNEVYVINSHFSSMNTGYKTFEVQKAIGISTISVTPTTTLAATIKGTTTTAKATLVPTTTKNSTRIAESSSDRVTQGVLGVLISMALYALMLQ
jgi:hypothetical protein